MTERNIGMEILEGIREIKNFNAGKAELRTRKLSENPQFMAIIERSRERLKKEGGMTMDEVRAKLGLKKD